VCSALKPLYLYLLSCLLQNKYKKDLPYMESLKKIMTQKISQGNVKSYLSWESKVEHFIIFMALSIAKASK
jgi:hypothetical protein